MRQVWCTILAVRRAENSIVVIAEKIDLGQIYKLMAVLL